MIGLNWLSELRQRDPDCKRSSQRERNRPTAKLDGLGGESGGPFATPTPTSLPDLSCRPQEEPERQQQRGCYQTRY